MYSQSYAVLQQEKQLENPEEALILSEWKQITDNLKKLNIKAKNMSVSPYANKGEELDCRIFKFLTRLLVKENSVEK